MSLSTYLESFSFTSLLYAAGVLALIAVGAAWALRRWPKRKGVVWLITFAAAIRVVITMTPVVAGALYLMLMNDPTVSTRVVSQLRLQLRSYLVESEAVTTIAVGSSQTHVLFDGVGDESEELFVYWLAGMNTLDYLIHQEKILDSPADKVLLNLSGFDLGELPSLESLQGVRLSDYRSYIGALYGIFALRGSYSDEQLFESGFAMLLTQVFPEFRFSHASHHLLTRMFSPRSTAIGLNNRQDQTAEDFRLRCLLELPAEPVEANFVMLRRFIDNAIAAKKDVYILQGQYRSDGYTPNNRKLEASVERRLKKWAAESPRLHYLSGSELPSMTDADYRDPWHATDSYGRKYAKAVLARLNAPKN